MSFACKNYHLRKDTAMNSLLLGLKKETKSPRLLTAALLCILSLITTSLEAKGYAPFLLLPSQKVQLVVVMAQ